MTPTQKKRIAHVAQSLTKLDAKAQRTAATKKHALTEDKIPSDISFDKAKPNKVGPVINNVDGRLKNISKYTDLLATAIEEKKAGKVQSAMRNLLTQINSLKKWLMQDVAGLVTASAKVSARKAEAQIAESELMLRRARRFLASVA